MIPSSLTAREILAALGIEHEMHTALSLDKDYLECSCGASLLVAEDAAGKLGIEHREMLIMLKRRLPGKVKA